MRILENYEPKEVLAFFEDLCKVPRASENMNEVSEFLANFAKERGLNCYVDSVKNVIIKKDASPGYEEKDAIILQGHMDMVAEKVEGSDFDFSKDGIKLVVNGDILSADGTTLGGDDGIGVAMMMAILDSDKIKHPKIEAVFTIDEEVGLIGAEALDMSILNGTRMINIDSEDEGIFTAGCAGGNQTNLKFPVKRENKKGLVYELKIDGLLGGHSGMEIDKEHGNANKIMARALYELTKKVNISLISLNGGRFDNAISKDCSAKILIDNNDANILEKSLDDFRATIKHELHATDPNVNFTYKKESIAEVSALDEISTKNIIFIVYAVPNGIQNMNTEVSGMVDTSLNLGVLNLNKDELNIIFGVRSSFDSRKKELVSRLTAFAEMFNGTIEVIGDYPGWEYLENSKLRDTIIELYRKMYNKEPIIDVTHAGLECGIFASKIGSHLDSISLGPDMRDVHTTDETLDLASTKRVWEFLVELLAIL